MTDRFRPYDPARDRDDCLRVYREVGWFKGNDDAARANDLWWKHGRTLVAEVGGHAECVVSNIDGRIRYLEEDLDLCVVGGVSTGRVARGRQLASRLTAEAVAADVVEHGAQVAILGIFEQGFYDRLGFGHGSLGHVITFDPGELDLPAADASTARVPVRVAPEDHRRVHANRRARRRPHGAACLNSADWTWADMLITKDGFGLGYADANTGELTHHLWGQVENVSNGPYHVKWMAYRDRREFLELMALLRGLGAQVDAVRMVQPPGLQLQDLLRRPIRRERIGRRTALQTGTRSIAWWQIRMCDIPACLERTRLPGDASVTFRLRLTDPIAEHLTDATRRTWSGVAGDYLVTLGPESSAEPLSGSEPLSGDAPAGVPTLATSVNTFTRLWLGVLRPTALAYTARDLDAPAELLARLDRVLAVPTPYPDWDF